MRVDDIKIKTVTFVDAGLSEIAGTIVKFGVQRRVTKI
jgi:hypothetical protein